tara:strand:- start:125 stop:322 length:198 start_codon:yes stop_codon:yes gene_type:complete
MTPTQEVREAMEKIDSYCNENNLKGHEFERKVLWNSLNIYSDLKDRNTDKFIEEHLHSMKNGLWT